MSIWCKASSPHDMLLSWKLYLQWHSWGSIYDIRLNDFAFAILFLTFFLDFIQQFVLSYISITFQEYGKGIESNQMNANESIWIHSIIKRNHFISLAYRIRISKQMIDWIFIYYTFFYWCLWKHFIYLWRFFFWNLYLKYLCRISNWDVLILCEM